MNNKFLFTFLLLCSIHYGLFATGDAKITIRLTHSNMGNKQLVLNTVADYIEHNVGAIEQCGLTDKNGSYTFHISGIKTYHTFNLQVIGLTYRAGYIAAGDDVIIEYSGDGGKGIQANYTSYRGKGSAALIAAGKFVSIPVVVFQQFNAKTDCSKLDLDTLCSAAQEACRENLSMLDFYRAGMSDAIYQQLQADQYGAVYSVLVSFLTKNIGKFTNVDALASLMAQLYQADPKLKVRALLQSKDYLGYRFAFASLMNAMRRVDNADSYLGICNELIKLDHGLLREKTLMKFLYRNNAIAKSQNPDLVYSSALSNIKTPGYRKLVKELEMSRRAGAMAYDFSMPDSSGKVVKLSDFKGKVVILDSWFTGCSSCILMARKIERDVLPQFKDNPSVVFVSICADKIKSTWLQSLNSGEYTNKGSVDLYTDGIGLSHPFMKKYNYYGFPQLMLIGKDGHLLSSSMPRDGKGMVNMINHALRK